MTSSALQEYARGILSHIPWEHWVVMAFVSLVLSVILLIRKKISVYGAITLGLTIFMGLFLLDTAVGIRCLGIMPHKSGSNLTLDFSRMFQKTGEGPAESISNIAVFVPFGFFLVEFLAEHLHYPYIGIIVDGKLYGSKAVKLGAGEVKNLEKARARRGVWVELGGELEKAAKTAGIEGVAELRNSNSETVGKILFGRPLGGINFNSRDLSEVETALTLVAVAISTEKAYK